MKFHKIRGNTYYISGPVNMGIFVFKNKNCVLFDTGINTSQARKFDALLKENSLHPKYIINTHYHGDHCAGNEYFTKEYPGCLVYSTLENKCLIENRSLFPSMIFSSKPPKQLSTEYTKRLNVDLILDFGINKINDEKFNVINLEGHCVNHIGVITHDKVCFLGDALFGEDTINKYSLPFLQDVEKTIETLKSLKNIDADLFVIGHCERVIEKSELDDLVDKNLKNIEDNKNLILELLDQPLTREDLLENMAILNNFSMKLNQYFIYFSSISAFLTYLLDNKLIDYSIENGKLYFFKI